MNGVRIIFGSFVVLTMAAAPALGQDKLEAGSQSSDQASESAKPNQRELSEMTSPKMEHMADAMASMAKTCDTMMKREMAMFPAKMIGAAILGMVGVVALVLLVVLEVQWIRLLGWRIRQSKRELASGKSS